MKIKKLLYFGNIIYVIFTPMLVLGSLVVIMFDDMYSSLIALTSIIMMFISLFFWMHMLRDIQVINMYNFYLKIFFMILSFVFFLIALCFLIA